VGNLKTGSTELVAGNNKKEIFEQPAASNQQPATNNPIPNTDYQVPITHLPNYPLTKFLLIRG
jgi:hypothetical protein